MTREEPSLEMWLQNIETMDKVQRIDRSNTAPSSKAFGDELYTDGYKEKEFTGIFVHEKRKIPVVWGILSTSNLTRNTTVSCWCRRLIAT
jgi:hypothetical protein